MDKKHKTQLEFKLAIQSHKEHSTAARDGASSGSVFGVDFALKRNAKHREEVLRVLSSKGLAKPKDWR